MGCQRCFVEQFKFRCSIKPEGVSLGFSVMDLKLDDRAGQAQSRGGRLYLATYGVSRQGDEMLQISLARPVSKSGPS